MSTAEQQRRWRAAKGARTGQPGRPPTATCPSVGAYKRHLRHGEDGKPCGCHAAYLEAQRGYYRRRRRIRQ